MTDFDMFIDESYVKDFWNEGFVVLREVIDPDLVFSMADPIRQTIAGSGTDLTELGSIVAPGNILTAPDVGSGEESGRFLAGTDHWVNNQHFADFACASVIPQIVAQILKSESVWLYEDSILIKEPNTACLLYTSPSPRDGLLSRMPSSA